MAPVHIVNPLWNANGGSEWHALSLFDLLAEHTDVALWSGETPDPALLGRYPINVIRQGVTKVPQGGNLVFVGAYQGIGGWIRHAKPRRVIVIYNVFQPERLFTMLAGLAEVEGLQAVEVSFVSDYLRRSTPGVEGVVNASPLDLSRFEGVRAEHPRFTVGRISRDVPEKHHPLDRQLYEDLVSDGATVRVLGGTCLGESATGLELLAEAREEAPDFLASLDAFFYRTHPEYQEAWGRVVLEAMAAGLPVVASPNGGYADAIEHGVNGFLISSSDEAREVLLRLRDDLALRASVGVAARDTARTIYSHENLAKIAEFYMR